MLDPSKIKGIVIQDNSKILTTNASSLNNKQYLKSNEAEAEEELELELEFSKGHYTDIDKSEEQNNFVYNGVKITELDVAPFVKEMLMQLILENEEYEKLATELQIKYNRRNSTENAKTQRFNSDNYALMKKTEDLTDIIKNFIKCKKIKKLVIFHTQ